MNADRNVFYFLVGHFMTLMQESLYLHCAFVGATASRAADGSPSPFTLLLLEPAAAGCRVCSPSDIIPTLLLTAVV